MTFSESSNRGAAIVLAFATVLSVVTPLLAGREGEPFSEADVKKFAVAVTKAAHPTGKKAALLKHSVSKKDGSLLIKMELEYYGATSNNRYTADSLLEIRLPKKLEDPFEVARIDFVDKNNSIAPNQKNLKKLIEEMNARFRIEKAK